jgi:uncharacterized protein (TIGR03382 family)
MIFVAWFAAALAQDIPAGATIDEALVANVTPEGLDQVGGLVAGFLPEDGIALDPVSVGDTGGNCLASTGLDATNINVGIEIVATSVVPSPGTITVEIDALVNVNDPVDRFGLDYALPLCVDGSCPGYVSAFPVTIQVPVALDIVQTPDGPVLDATVGQALLDNGLQGSDIDLDCGLQTIENVLSALNLSIFDFIIGFAEDFIVDEINSQAAEIELLIEDAFNAATIEQSIEIQPGAVLDLRLAPHDLQIDASGVQLVMEGSASADPAACIAPYDVGSSPGTAGAAPSIASEPPGTQLAAHASDDFVNQALYGVWRSGLLCQEIAEGEFGGFSIDTQLLGLLGGTPYQELFPETQPMIIQTVPTKPLVADFTGPNDIDVPLEDFEVRFFAELDGRMARALGVAISPDVGVNLEFDDTVGELGVDIALGNAFRTELTGDSMTPGQDAEVLSNVDGALVGLVDTLVGSLLGDAIAFPVPGLGDGLGLTALQAAPTGGGEWLGIYAELGPVTYEPSSCEDGCSGGSGCSSSATPAWGFAALMALLIRRRRR